VRFILRRCGSSITVTSLCEGEAYVVGAADDQLDDAPHSDYERLGVG